jgi:DNA-binding NarL/FixJ family response regulator
MMFHVQHWEEIMKTRLVLADDHTLFAQALGSALAERYEVVDIVADGKALQATVAQHKPDVVVTDITMPLLSGLESARLLCKQTFVPKIVFLTMHVDAGLARECFDCGGSGFVVKEAGCEELITAIDAVLANQLYLSPNIAGGAIDALKAEPASASGFERLTARQREMLQLFAEGKSMKEIATAVNLSTRTVEWHKHRLMKVLSLRRSAELVQFAVRMKLVT